MQAWRCPTPSEPIDATVSLPGSKSLSARALLAAALADAPSQIEGLLESRDTALMRAALAAYAQKAATNNGDFFDVPTSHWAYDTVKWAVDRGITNGTSATSFSPNSTCTKAQILTFLWRAKGEPAAGNTNPFQDVPLSAYYYQPALWARNQGLVNGTLFQPNSPCTRAQTVYYLWQLAGSPNVSGTTNFQDVPGNATYAKAVQWAVQQKITDGTSFTTFSPLDTCTRAQIVTFLYRALK